MTIIAWACNSEYEKKREKKTIKLSSLELLGFYYMKFIYNNAWMCTNKTDRDSDLVLGNEGKKHH